MVEGFSAALCRGLIEAPRPGRRGARAGRFSAALCRGLIEASHYKSKEDQTVHRFPRLYAAASLKHLRLRCPSAADKSFPRLYAAASLKPLQTLLLASGSEGVFRGFMPRPH